MDKNDQINEIFITLHFHSFPSMEKSREQGIDGRKREDSEPVIKTLFKTVTHNLKMLQVRWEDPFVA